MIALCAILYAVAVAVLAATGLAFVGGGLSPRLAAISLGVGALTAAATFYQGRNRPFQPRKLRPWEWAAVVAFSLFALRAFLWVVFPKGDDWCVLSPNNLGDLSIHLTYIRLLASGVPFWPENPILGGTLLTYPLGVDLLHSLLLLVGADLFRTFVWMGLAGAALTGFALWRWGGAFTLAGFLCNGGLAGLAFVLPGTFLVLEDFQAKLGWKSIPLALFVTQRGLLFALPAGLVLLCSWRARFFPGAISPEQRQRDQLPLWGEALLYAAMPLFHLHTFIFLSLLLLGWFIAQASARGQLMRLVLFAVVPASFLVLLVTGKFSTPSALGWQPGWMQGDEEFALYCRENLGVAQPWLVAPLFWIVNFGALPVFVAVLVWTLFRTPKGPWVDPRRPFARATVITALGVFLLCCFVRFAPWPWDNTKLMIWSYLILLPFLWEDLLQRWRFAVRAAAVALLFFSGGLSLLGGLDHSHDGYPIARQSELDTLASPLATLPPGTRLIAHPDYNHPALLLGYPLALGYTGHVWSHGYDYREPLAHVQAVLSGAANWREEARALRCRYLFWGTKENAAYQASPRPWETECRVVAACPFGTIYDLESARAASHPAPSLPPDSPADPRP